MTARAVVGALRSASRFAAGLAGVSTLALGLLLAAVFAGAPARAEEKEPKERTASDQELGGADLCPQVKGIVKSADKEFERTKGKLIKENAKTSFFEGRLWVPEARGCKLITYKDGSAPFYACELRTSSCAKAAAQYEQLALDLATCLGNEHPKIKRTENSLSTRFAVDKAQVRVVFKKAPAACEITLFVEK